MASMDVDAKSDTSSRHDKLVESPPPDVPRGCSAKQRGQQKRMITASSSKLGKKDLIAILRDPGAWFKLPEDSRKRLYRLLPQPASHESPHDPDVHPLQGPCRPYIEEEIRRWQSDLRDGRESKKWRIAALEAGQHRRDGKFGVLIAETRMDYWANADKPPKAKTETVDQAEGNCAGNGTLREENQSGDDIQPLKASEG